MNAPFSLFLSKLHQVFDKDFTVVNVAVSSDRTVRSSCTTREWVCDHAIAGLETDLRLEAMLADCSDHLHRNVWAVEQACVEGRCTLITYNKVLTRSVWVDIDAEAAIQHTSEGVTSVINV